MSTKEAEILEKYDRESVTRSSLPKTILSFIAFTALILSLFHLYTSFAGPLVDIKQRSVHLYVLLALTFLLYPLTKKSKNKGLPFYDILFAALSLGVGVYMFMSYQRIIDVGGRINDIDLVVGVLAILLILDATRRVVGWGMPILAIAFLAYGFYTKLSIYPTLNIDIFLSFSKSIIAHLVFVTEGILGTAIGVSASYIIMFILFGAFLGKSGMGQLFNDMSMALAGHTKGGPAKVSVIASGFLGSINGAAVANVVTTGAFTIPLMKKVGYKKNFAGAVEAAASVGGQILPPIMGAAAFIMAENLSMPYTQIILAGIIPALLFYLGVILQVHFRASKNNLTGIPRSELPRFKTVLAERGHLFVPMLALVYLLFSGKTPLFAAFWSIVATVLISGTKRTVITVLSIVTYLMLERQIFALFTSAEIPAVRADWWLIAIIVLVPVAINILRNKLNIVSAEVMNLTDCKDALIQGSKTSIAVALACATVGIVVGIATLTGVALDLASNIVSIGETVSSPVLQLIIILFFTMIASIILGMGLPSIPCYIITSTMAAPILLNTPLFRELAGSPENAIFIAHMFVFYFGIFANITPPVALASFAATGISGGDPTKTGFQSMKLAIAGFIVPFMFVFSPAMLMIDASVMDIIVISVTSIIGVVMLSVSVEGYFFNAVPTWLRYLSAVGALMLIFSGVTTDIIGLAILAILVIVNLKAGNKVETTTEQPKQKKESI